MLGKSSHNLALLYPINFSEALFTDHQQLIQKASKISHDKKAAIYDQTKLSHGNETIKSK